MDCGGKPDARQLLLPTDAAINKHAMLSDRQFWQIGWVSVNGSIEVERFPIGTCCSVAVWPQGGFSLPRLLALSNFPLSLCKLWCGKRLIVWEPDGLLKRWGFSIKRNKLKTPREWKEQSLNKKTFLLTDYFIQNNSSLTPRGHFWVLNFSMDFFFVPDGEKILYFPYCELLK